MKLRLFLNDYFDRKAKRVTMLQLRKMTDRQLLDCGFSPALLNEGIKAWPWRELEDNLVGSGLGRLPAVAPSIAQSIVRLPKVAKATEAPQKAAA